MVRESQYSQFISNVSLLFLKKVPAGAPQIYQCGGYNLKSIKTCHGVPMCDRAFLCYNTPVLCQETNCDGLITWLLTKNVRSFRVFLVCSC